MTNIDQQPLIQHLADFDGKEVFVDGRPPVSGAPQLVGRRAVGGNVNVEPTTDDAASDLQSFGIHPLDERATPEIIVGDLTGKSSDEGAKQTRTKGPSLVGATVKDFSKLRQVRTYAGRTKAPGTSTSPKV